jgi:hypothetical protein
LWRQNNSDPTRHFEQQSTHITKYVPVLHSFTPHPLDMLFKIKEILCDGISQAYRPKLLLKRQYVPTNCRSQWHRGIRRGSSAARLLRLWVRIPRGAWMFVCCECCVLSGRGLCDGLITRPEESDRLWRVVVCDIETSKTRRLKPATGL